MNVGELIKALQSFNPELEVHLIDSYDDEELMYSIKKIFEDTPWIPITQKPACMMYIEKEEG